jgi:uncharacterized protein
MTRVVLDTNVIVSGLIWGGTPRRFLDLARQQSLRLYTSAALLAELADVLGRPKFVGILTANNLTPDIIVRGYAALAHPVRVLSVTAYVERDPDDDHVIACALSAKAGLIVTGDQDLLCIQQSPQVLILNPSDALAWLDKNKPLPQHG